MSVRMAADTVCAGSNDRNHRDSLPVLCQASDKYNVERAICIARALEFRSSKRSLRQCSSAGHEMS
jgi:hypothetical protein